MRRLFLLVVIFCLHILPVAISTACPEKRGFEKKVIITIIYDNDSLRSDLKSSWGFSCMIDKDDTKILFDTGGDGEILLHNMSKLGIDPADIDSIVLSHIHGDHTGGLSGLLRQGYRFKIYLPASFSYTFKKILMAAGNKVVELEDQAEIIKGITTTGVMGKYIHEQGLVIRTKKGAILVTGCAHPGIVHMVERTIELTSGPVFLVLGGFHLFSLSEHEIHRIAEKLKKLGVQRVAPCHCSGGRAKKIFEEVFGADYILAGAGLKLEIPY